MAECPYARRYRPSAYLFSGERMLRIAEETSEGAVCSEEVREEIGLWGIVEKREYPSTGEMLTCCGVGEGHYHAEVVTGSTLQPRKTGSTAVQLTAGKTEEGQFAVSYQLRLSLGLSPGDTIVLKRCLSIETFPEARKVELRPLSAVAGTLRPKRSELPAIIRPGMTIVKAEKARPHALFGNLFSVVGFYIVESVNDQRAADCQYRIGDSTSLFLSVFHEGDELPPNGELALNARVPGVFECDCLRQRLDTLVRLLDYQKREGKRPCPVHISGPKGSGKRALIRLAALRSGFTYIEVSFLDYANIAGIQQLLVPTAEPTVLHIRHFAQTLRLLLFGQTHQSDRIQQVFQQFTATYTQRPMVLVASSQASDLPGTFRNLFHMLIDTELPGESDRTIALSALCEFHALTSLDCKELSRRCVGKSFDELCYIVEQCVDSTDAWSVVDRELRVLRQRKGGAEGIPSVHWDDIGGLEHAKTDIIDTVLLPLQRPDLFSTGIRQRSGLLLYGPPGTGKTLLAKAVATECSLNFIAIKGPELLNMYIGESEANIRNVFQRGRDARPCVLFFDELDSLAPARGTGSDSGGVMDRIVSQLLTELDGAQQTSGLYVIGATNRPDLLDPALLRPGRFDKMVYLGLAEDKPSQVKILRALTSKFHLDASCDLERITGLCGESYTGADFYALCCDALMSAYRRRVDALEVEVETHNSQHYYEPAIGVNEFVERFPLQGKVVVRFEDFEKALEHFQPSLSQEEVARYKSLKSRIERK